MDNEHNITVKALLFTNRDGFTCFEVNFPDFENLNSVRDIEVESPEFACFGRQWKVKLHPRGDEDAEDGMASIFLEQGWGGRIEVDLELGYETEAYRRMNKKVFCDYCSWGWSNFELRSDLVEKLDNGTLIIRVGMRQVNPIETCHFVPPNFILSAIRKTFNDEKSSDVLFLVGGQQIKEERTKKVKVAPTQYYAHRHILRECAPVLADLCDHYKDRQPMSIIDTKPNIFGILLQYIYGIIIPAEELEINAKEIIDASDKYGVVGLKLQAEASYVQTTTINMENLIENLQYANAKNCALLNEAVMDFVVENGDEVLENISFSDCPGDVTSDLLAHVMRDKKKGSEDSNNGAVDYTTMRVNTLRRMCHEKGLDCDGSRKTMISLLKSTQESTD